MQSSIEDNIQNEELVVEQPRLWVVQARMQAAQEQWERLQQVTSAGIAHGASSANLPSLPRGELQLIVLLPALALAFKPSCGWESLLPHGSIVEECSEHSGQKMLRM